VPALSLNVITNSIPEDNTVTEAPNHFQFSLQTGEDLDTHTHSSRKTHLKM